MKFKIRPTISECKSCTETTSTWYSEPSCDYCKTEEYTMLKLEKDYVYYIDDDQIKKAHMDHVIVVNEI